MLTLMDVHLLYFVLLTVTGNFSTCSNPLNTSDVYYYGEYLTCGDGMELTGGAQSMQCTMGHSVTDLSWSHEFTGCRK